MINIELAPMEGVITATYRKLFKKYFGGVDRYYTPFIAANQTHTFKEREKREFLPYADDLIPQILTNSPEDFIWAAVELKKIGYEEVNLNTGCPSGTVVAKGKGAGMLAAPAKLKAFLDEIFEAKEKMDLPNISVKTRVGISSYDEANALAEIFAGYSFSSIIVHPRVRDDIYNGKPNIDAFNVFYDTCREQKLVYNGDLYTPMDVSAIISQFPDIAGVMLGRGVLMDPLLPAKVRENENKTTHGIVDGPDNNKLILGFLNELWEEYASYLSGERDVLFKMKDLWNFMGHSYPNNQKALKAIKKAKNHSEYNTAMNDILS